MRCVALAVLLTVVAVLVVPGSRAQEQPLPPGAIVKRVAGHDVFEARFVLVAPTVAVDPRLRHVLGEATSDPNGRFLTVGDVDPERILENLYGLGDLVVMDRANLVAEDKKPARYVQSLRIPVPQVEVRDESKFVRQKYESVGTKVSVVTDGLQVSLDLEANFVLDHTADGIFPLIASAGWSETFDLAPGRTAVFKSQFHLPGLVRGGPVGKNSPPQDRTRILLVLVSRSPLP